MSSAALEPAVLGSALLLPVPSGLPKSPVLLGNGGAGTSVEYLPLLLVLEKLECFSLDFPKCPTLPVFGSLLVENEAEDLFDSDNGTPPKTLAIDFLANADCIGFASPLNAFLSPSPILLFLLKGKKLPVEGFAKPEPELLLASPLLPNTLLVNAAEGLVCCLRGPGNEGGDGNSAGVDDNVTGDVNGDDAVVAVDKTVLLLNVPNPVEGKAVVEVVL